MGANNHPTVDVSNEPDRIFSVIDTSDSWNQVKVATFTNEAAANDLARRKNEERFERVGREPFVVRDVPIFDSADEWENHET
jgi:hypothetical protein